MTVEEFIELSRNAKMPDIRFQNKKYITGEYPIRDIMDGTLNIRYYTGKKKGWTWIPSTVKHCVECSEPIIVFGKSIKHLSDSFCNKQCKYKYHHARLEPIEYNGKLYTLDDCNPYGIKTYLNPINALINSLKSRARRMEDPEYVEKERIRVAKAQAISRKLNPPTEEQRLENNKRNNKNYHANRENRLAQQKEAKANWTPERKAQANKVKNKWAKQDKENNPAKYRIKSVISGVFERMGKKKINRTISYGIDVKAIAKHLELLAVKIGRTFKWMHENGYHIDHIIAVNLYNGDDEDDFRNCNNKYNLRWLPAKENQSKGDTLRPEDIEVIKTLPPEIYPKSWGGVIPVQ
jgi:hypothetical protein